MSDIKEFELKIDQDALNKKLKLVKFMDLMEQAQENSMVYLKVIKYLCGEEEYRRMMDHFADKETEELMGFLLPIITQSNASEQ